MGPELERSYRHCRRLARAHATSYHLAARLLPAAQRRHVHAVYGFCRHADDIVDGPGRSATDRAAELEALGERLYAGLAAGGSQDPLLAAVVHTVASLGIDPSCFERFLASMAMDLTVSAYGTFEELLAYMEGSAAAVGEMMLPVLGAAAPAALGPARDLGIAFQLTNFLRDVAEDLDRGRVYLPAEDLDRFGAAEALARRRVTEGWAELMAFEIARARRYYRSAEQGLAWLPGPSAGCVAAAHRLYGAILERIVAAGYDVFSGRARVPTWRKAALVAGLRLRGLQRVAPASLSPEA